ncbi:MAG: purine-binding chemotaxis protein CheW [bacterium]|nr:purine-binding chemotaxis protein CheW [bacterium]
MNEKNGVSQTSLQIVCFKIGKEEYGVDILQVQEILKLPKITKLPKSLAYIMGVIDLRGKVIPIIDLSKKFGIDTGSSGKSRVIVVDISGKQVGLAIDSVSHVVRVNSGDIEPPPPVVKGISGKYIIGIAKLTEGFVVILDIRQIFTTEEIKSI